MGNIREAMDEKNKEIGMTEYERLREETIAQNKQFLASKGLDADKYQFSMPKKVHEGKGRKERNHIVKETQPRRSLRRRGLGQGKNNPSKQTESPDNVNNEPKFIQSEPKVIHEGGNQHSETDSRHAEDIPQKALDKESKLRELYFNQEKFEVDTSNQPPNTPATFPNTPATFVDALETSHGHDAPPITSELKDQSAQYTRKHKLQQIVKSYKRRGRHAREKSAEGKKPFLFEVRDGRPIGKSSSSFEGDTSNQPPISPSASFVDALERSHGHDAPPITGEKDDQSLTEAGITRNLRMQAQGARRRREREAREERAEGKKPFLLEVRDGKPIGKNRLKWGSELGLNVRSHLDFSVPNFSNQNRRNIDIVIRNMENSFETVGGKISMKCYRSRMRVIINRYRFVCRKKILNGTGRDESFITPNQWQALKDSMQSEDCLDRSVESKRARSLLQKPHIYGREGIKAKEERFGTRHDRLPDVESSGTNDAVLKELTETVKMLFSSLQPIITAWNKGEFYASKETDTIMPNDLRLNNIGRMSEVLETRVSTSFGKQTHIVSKTDLVLSKNHFKLGDRVKLLDLCHGELAGYGSIHSLSTFHGEALSVDDVNVCAFKVVKDISLPYEDKEGCTHLTEKLDSFFLKWPVGFLMKI